MLSSKKEELRREIARRERELERLESLPDLSALLDGSVLALFVAHGSRGATYTYVAYLTGGRFYLTGKTAPNGVTADGLADWLTTGARRLVAVAEIGRVVTEVSDTEIFDLGEALLSSLGSASGRTRGSEWRDTESWTDYVG